MLIIFQLGFPTTIRAAEVEPIQDQNQNQSIVPVVEAPVALKPPRPGYGGECVVFARNFLKIDNLAFGGYAGRIKPNSQIPEIGSVVLTRTHAAVIIDMTEDEIILAESNYHWDHKITSGRRMKIDDPQIRGYFNP